MFKSKDLLHDCIYKDAKKYIDNPYISKPRNGTKYDDLIAILNLTPAPAPYRSNRYPYDWIDIPVAIKDRFYPKYLNLYTLHISDWYYGNGKLSEIYKYRNRAIYVVLESCSVPDDIIRYAFWKFLTDEYCCPKFIS